MSASLTIQAASIFYLDNLLATAFALYTRLFWLHFSTSTLSPITIFWICRIQLLPQGCGGSLAQSLVHLILRVCWNQYQFNHLLLGLVVSRFGCIFLLLAIPASFLLHRHFLHAHFSGFFVFHTKMKTKGEVFHIKSYFSLFSFAGMYTHRHSVLKGPRQFPFPVLARLNVPVYTRKFVTRTFLPGGNYYQEAVIISSDHTMPHHKWRIFIKFSALQF